MLLDINGNVLNNPINQTPITEKWGDYIVYTKNTYLCDFTKQELLKRISAKKRRGISIIHTTIIIGRFLRELSVNDNFYQYFKASFPKLDCSTVLGMQLYILLQEDSNKWTFLKPDNEATILKSASYIISK